MKFIKQTLGSFRRLICAGKMDSREISRQNTQRIREFMLSEMKSVEIESCDLTALKNKIIFASDALTLWYLRSDWFIEVSKNLGQAQALKAQKKLDSMLDKLIPSSMHSGWGLISYGQVHRDN